MYCSIQRRTNGTAWLRWLGRSVLAGSLSAFAMACSGGVESGAEPEDENLPLERMPPAVSNMDSDGAGPNDTETTEGDGPSNESTPEATGLEGAGNALDAEGDSDADEGDAEESDAMSMLPPPEVPAGDYCESVADWDPEWVQFEEEVLLLVNEFRSEPADCGEEGQFGAAAPLSMDPILRCSARLHSLDMFTLDYFAHDNLDGITPGARMMTAGFQGSYYGENIAQGQRTPDEVMSAWMESDGHCANIMRAEYTLIGIGYEPGAAVRQGKSNYWTQNFGAPRAVRQRP